MKYYTGTGDKKLTSIGAVRLSKAEDIFEAIGDVDELNTKVATISSLIMSRAERGSAESGSLAELSAGLLSVESMLFSIGAELASSVNRAFAPSKKVSSEDIKGIEQFTDSLSKSFPALKSFVLPGGCAESAAADEARAVARRAERSIIRMSNSTAIENENIFAYMNRLSSLFFVLARYMNAMNGVKEIPPRY